MTIAKRQSKKAGAGYWLLGATDDTPVLFAELPEGYTVVRNAVFNRAVRARRSYGGYEPPQPRVAKPIPQAVQPLYGHWTVEMGNDR